MVCTITAPVYAAGIFLPEESNTKQAESTNLIEAPSGILMEAQTGTVVYQKDADTRRSPASITKIMTLILIFDALDKGSLKMDDTVTTSAHAKSMGGSQVFLEEGEIQTVETLLHVFDMDILLHADIFFYKILQLDIHAKWDRTLKQ